MVSAAEDGERGSCCVGPSADLGGGHLSLYKAVYRPPVLGARTGVVMGWVLGRVAMDVDPISLTQDGQYDRFRALCCFFGSLAVYMTLVDAIYAHQDLPDDGQAGIRSLAVTYRQNLKGAMTVMVIL